MSLKEFQESVPASKDYAAAEKERDRIIENGERKDEGCLDNAIKFDGKNDDTPSFEEYANRVHELWLEDGGEEKDFQSADGQWYVKRGYKAAIEAAKSRGLSALDKKVLDSSVLASMRMEF